MYKRQKEDWSVVEGAIPRIVSDEMFDEVNKMLRVEARGIEKSTKKRKKNLFICPYCGRKLMNSSAVCTPKLLCPKRRMVRTGECQQIFMLKSEAQDKVLEITKEICRTLIQEEELKKASKDKRKVKMCIRDSDDMAGYYQKMEQAGKKEDNGIVSLADFMAVFFKRLRADR